MELDWYGYRILQMAWHMWREKYFQFHSSKSFFLMHYFLFTQKKQRIYDF